MRPSVIQFSGGLGMPGVNVGLDGLKGFFQPSSFYDMKSQSRPKVVTSAENVMHAFFKTCL